MVEKKVKIGIDIDEVVVEFFRGYLKLFNKRFENNLEFEDLTEYHIWDLTDISKEDSLLLADEFQSSDNFKDNFIEGAKESILFLSEFFDIFFLTSRPIILKDKTQFFLGEHFDNFNLLFSGDMRGELKSKSEICEEFGIKIMIEDNQNYALDCAKKGVKTFLLDKPWNKNYEKHENLIKVKGWNEILEKMK